MIDWCDVKIIFTGEKENLDKLEAVIDKLIKSDECELYSLLKEEVSQAELFISYQSNEGYCHSLIQDWANKYSLELSGVCVEVGENGATCNFIIGKRCPIFGDIEVRTMSHKDVLEEL